jgi:nucleoside-diphosphate-sugar epimerase
MKVIILGASGMVGAGALCEALKASNVEHVLSIGRHPCGRDPSQTARTAPS